ncbi:unnamed protein product [Somion occarium]|uniref:Uncharacterized protein n=1 Tax=Somion occarium TaxID=3059160 RepID=A0ABP1DJL5_9APHY
MRGIHFWKPKKRQGQVDAAVELRRGHNDELGITPCLFAEPGPETVQVISQGDTFNRLGSDHPKHARLYSEWAEHISLVPENPTTTLPIFRTDQSEVNVATKLLASPQSQPSTRICDPARVTAQSDNTRSPKICRSLERRRRRAAIQAFT